MEKYTEEASAIKQHIKKMKNETKLLDNKIDLLITEVNSNIIEKKKKEIFEMICQTQYMISEIKKRLDDMFECTKFFEKEQIQNQTFIIYQNIHISLTNKLIKAVYACNTRHIKFRNYIDNISKDQTFVQTNNTNDINNTINAKDTNITSELLPYQKSTIHKQDRLQYYKEMKSDIIDIEQQIFQLKQFFIDASMQVSHQSNLINNIEHNVKKSKRCVNNSINELDQAINRF